MIVFSLNAEMLASTIPFFLIPTNERNWRTKKRGGNIQLAITYSKLTVETLKSLASFWCLYC